jgi:hypothetical protein
MLIIACAPRTGGMHDPMNVMRISSGSSGG